jgi:transposase
MAIRSSSFLNIFLLKNPMNLTDEQWRLIEPILPPPSPADRGRPPIDRRAVLNGILWKFRTDNPWYDMPPDYPSHQTCYRCHRKWARDGVMQKIYDALFSDLITRGGFDFEQALQDGIIRVNQIASLEILTIPPRLRDTWQWSTVVLFLRPKMEKIIKHEQPSIRIVFEG